MFANPQNFISLTVSYHMDWCGQTYLPKVLTYKNTLLATYAILPTKYTTRLLF